MGYFHWYWKTFGFFTAIRAFFLWPLCRKVIYSLFYGIGLAIGTFLFKKYGLPPLGLSQFA